MTESSLSRTSTYPYLSTYPRTSGYKRKHHFHDSSDRDPASSSHKRALSFHYDDGLLEFTSRR